VTTISILYSSARIAHLSRHKLGRGLLLSGSAGLALSSLPARAQNSVSLRNNARGSLAPAPIPARVSAARVAIERAKQLEAQGIPSLAAVQFREALAQAPTSIEAARELARFYGRQKRYEEAAEAWRHVLFLKRGADKEATTQLAVAQNQLLSQSDGLPASTAQTPIASNTRPGADDENAFTSNVSSAQTTPRLAQNTDPAVTSPDTTTPDTTAPITVAPDATAPLPDASTSATPAPSDSAPANVPDATTPLADTPAPSVVEAAPSAPLPVPTPRVPAATAPRRAAPRVPARTVRPRAASANVSAIPFIAPPRATRRVSKVQAAKAWPFVNRAAKELGAGRTQSALGLYQQAYRIDPNNAYAAPGIGTSYTVLGRFNEAAAIYRQYLALKPNDPKALRGLANALTFGRKYREALGVNNAILARNPRDFAAALQNGQLLTYLRAYPASDRFFNTAVASAPDQGRKADAHVAWGESLSYRRDPRALSNFQRALALRPNNPRALAGLGNYYSFTGQFSAAVAPLRAALAARPGDAALQTALGDALTYTGQSGNAVPLYRAALQKQPNNLAARLGLGRALVYAGQSEAGATQLRRVLSAQPGNTAALEALALAQSDFAPSQGIESYQTLLSRQTDPAARARTLATIGDLSARNNDFSRAIDSYAQANRLAPSDPKIGLGYAQLLASQERFDAARPVLESVLAGQPNNVQALALQVQIENRTGNTERAKTLAASLENVTPASVDESLSLAEALRATGNTASANRVLASAVSAAATPASALRLADATRDAGDYAGAAALYQKILASDARNIPARLSLAETLIYQNDIEGANAQINQVLAVDPGNVQAKILTATASLRVDTPASRDAAAAQASAVLETDPGNAAAKVIVGQVLTSRQRFADAVAQFRSAVEAQPNNLPARLGLARNLYYSRDVEGSITEYRELIRRMPTETLPRLELAQIFLDRNRFSESEALFNEVLAMRGGLPVNATARWKVETRAYAKFSPLDKINSPLRAKRAKSRRVVVDAPVKLAPVKTALVKTAKIGSRRRIYLAQNVDAGAGTIDPAASSSGAAPLPEATDTAPAPVDVAPSAPDVIVNTPPVVEAPAPPDVSTAITPAPPSAAAPVAGAGDPVLSDQLTALRGLGEIRRRQGRFGEALDFFNQALALDTNDSAARIGVAQSLRGQNKYTEALEQADRVIASDAANLPARVLRAQLLGDTNQPEAAQKELDTLVSSLPDNAPLDTYLNLTQAFNSLKNYPASLQLLDEAAQVYPSEPAIPRLRAETLTFARRVPEAIAIYDQLIAADPQDADAILGKARVYNYTNQLDLAEPVYRQVLSVQPANYQATTELADVLGRRANYAESIALYQSAIATNPTDLATRVELARVQRFSGAGADAEATLNSVIESDARNVPALTERGVLRGTLGSYAPAIADLNAALEISPNDLDAQLGLAEVQSYAGNYAQSIQGYRTVLARDPQNLKARTGLGMALSYNGQTDEALKELDAALALTPGDVNARLAKADVLGRANRTTEAVALYNGVLAADANNIRARTGLADAYLYGRQYPNAIRVYDALIAQNPTNTNFRIQRARALGYDGRAREAVTALRAIVQSEPDNLSARLALAEAGTNSGNPDLVRDAIADYRNILASDSTNVPAQVGLARALSYRGNYGEAKSRLETVLAANPGNTEARLALAETQRFQGDAFGARDNYDQVLQTQPNNASARRGRRVVVKNTSPRLTLGGSYYNDTNGVTLRSLNYGGFLPTRAGTIGVLAERGRFEQNGSERDRNALSLILSRAFGPVQARLALTRLKYGGAPSRTLYDLLLNNVRGPRQRYYLNFAKRDIFESDAAVAQGITAAFVRAGFTQPLGDKFDFEFQATRYRYSDRNNRTSIQPSIYYRFRPTNPSLRIGLGYFYDNTAERRDNPFIYYTPQGFNATSILADYVVDQGDTRYGIFGAYPLTGATGNNGTNRPAKTLFGFVNHDLSDALELFAEGGIVRTPDFRSNQINGGVNFRFN